MQDGPRYNTDGSRPWPAPLGNPPTPAASGQLQTTSHHHHPAPAQLILHRRWSLVVSGHNQSMQLTGLGKSFPLTCQQQPSLKYKRMVYSAHKKCVPQVPSMVIGDATGPYRTPTTLGHTTKTGSQNSSTLYIETKTGRLPK